MTHRRELAFLAGVIAVSLCGCAPSTDVAKDQNDAYHNRQAGGKPTGAQLSKSMSAKNVGPFANSGGVPPGAGPPPAGVKMGPGDKK